MSGEKPVGHQLSDAVAAGDTATFERLMRAHPEAVWSPGRPGWTHWMMSAADEGQVGILELLVAAGADVNTPKAATGWESAPEGVVVMAASEGRLEATRWLLDRGAVLNHTVCGQERCFALSSTAAVGHLEVVKLLIDRGAAVNACWAGMTALDHALTYRQQAVADYLRSVGAKTAAELPG